MTSKIAGVSAAARLRPPPTVLMPAAFTRYKGLEERLVAAGVLAAVEGVVGGDGHLIDSSRG
ncbi:MAG TPA: hypothetical protein VIK11_08600 [Tepidiformaceae bacterium]